VLRPIKVVASTYLYLCIWSIVGIGQHVVSFSHSNLLIVAIWPEWIFPCKVPEDREEQYLCVAAALLARSMVMDIPTGVVLLLHQPKISPAYTMTQIALLSDIQVVCSTRNQAN